MTYNLILKQVNSLFLLDLFIKHCVFKIKTRKNYNSIFFKIFLKLIEFSDNPSPI